MRIDRFIGAASTIADVYLKRALLTEEDEQNLFSMLHKLVYIQKRRGYAEETLFKAPKQKHRFS